LRSLILETVKHWLPGNDFIFFLVFPMINFSLSFTFHHCREKLKRKQNKAGDPAASASLMSVKPDPQYINTIQMMSCVIMTMSYDVPDYLPNLVTSFLRHVHYSDVLKSQITKTIQLFKRTHQDRWEEYQLKFSTEQLADLQGAGAAHYFS
jgi:hypothetical protein